MTPTGLPEAAQLPAPFGRYRLEEVLGEGGMGRVYRATLQGPGGFRKQVALKVIRPLDGRSSEEDGEAEKVFVREARLGGLLSHPNVIDVYDFGVHEGHPFLAMELVRGWALDRLLAAHRLLPPTVVLDLSIQIAEGLQHAHELRVDGQPVALVHRDLKPGNVLVTRQGGVKVMDFGLARTRRADDMLTATGVVQGTPAFMSPEQAAGDRALDPRSDLFAFGVLLYVLGAGKLPWSRPTFTAQVMALVLVDELTAKPGFWDRPEKGLPGVGPILKKCLRRDPDERFARCADLVAALRRLEEQLPAGPNLRAWLDATVGDTFGASQCDVDAETIARPPAGDAASAAGSTDVPLQPRPFVEPLEGPWPATYRHGAWRATVGLEEFGQVYVELDALPVGPTGRTKVLLEGISPVALGLEAGTAVLLGEPHEILGGSSDVNPWLELVLRLPDGELVPLGLEPSQ